MRPRPLLALAVLGAAALVAASVVRVPAEALAVRSWTGGGTPELLEPGFRLRLPLAQRVDRYPGGVVETRGEVDAASREGSRIGLPFEIRVRVRPQDLLELHREGGAGGRTALAGLAAEQIRRAAASYGTYDLASGNAAAGVAGAVRRALEPRFGTGAVTIGIGPPVIPPEVRAAFEKDAVYGLRRDTGRRVLLLGVDGADWEFIDPLIARGELPHLGRLKRGGAWAVLRSNVPTLSPLLWTTVATGKSPDRHGINDFLVADPRTGRRVPINSTFRRAKALWNILTEAGLDSATVAWWATWPAEPVRGWLVSDRVAYSTFQVARPDGERGAVHPPEYAADIARLKVSEEEIPYARVARFLNLREGEFRRARERAARGRPGGDGPGAPAAPEAEAEESINLFVRVLAATDTYHRIALDLLGKDSQAGDRLRFMALYFQGVDEVNHRFAHCAPPRMPLCPERDYRRFGDSIRAFYRHQDALLGEILRVAGAEWTVVLISDHGFASGAARPADVKPFIEGKPGLWHDLTGVFLAHGPGIARGEIPTVTLYDIAPTILHLLGLPVPEDMPGKVLEAALDADFRAAHAIARVPSYEGLLAAGERPEGEPGPGRDALAGGTATGDDPAEAEMIAQLRALGYVGGAEGAGGAGEAATVGPGTDRAGNRGPGGGGAPGPGGAGGMGRGAAPAGPPRAGGEVPTLLYHTNLGAVYLGRRQFDLAEAEFRRALAIDPGAGQALSGMAILHEMRGEPEKALDWLRALLRTGQGDDQATLVKIAELFVRMGRPADGLAFLRGLEARPPAGGETGRGAPGVPAGDTRDRLRRDLGLRIAFGLLYSAAGQTAEAERQLLDALAVDPASVPAMQELFSLYDAAGRAPELEPRLREALRREPRSAMHHNWLGLVLRRRGDLEGAEAEFRRTLQVAPDLVGAMANLGSLYLQQQRHAEAVAVLRRALEKDARNVESRTNLIVALGMTRDLDGARLLVDEALRAGHRASLYHNALAYVLHLNGRNEEALEEIRRSLEIDPRQPDALRLRAEIEQAGPAPGLPYR